MEVPYMILASYAESRPDGKIVVIAGDLDTILVPPSSFPAVSALPLYLLVKITFPAAECGTKHDLRVEFASPSGAPIAETSAVLDPPPPQPGRLTKVIYVVTFAGLAFPVAGDYAVQVSINGTERNRMPVYVVAQ